MVRVELVQSRNFVFALEAVSTYLYFGEITHLTFTLVRTEKETPGESYVCKARLICHAK